jgi:hypothetical protein
VRGTRYIAAGLPNGVYTKKSEFGYIWGASTSVDVGLFYGRLEYLRPFCSGFGRLRKCTGKFSGIIFNNFLRENFPFPHIYGGKNFEPKNTMSKLLVRPHGMMK